MKELWNLRSGLIGRTKLIVSHVHQGELPGERGQTCFWKCVYRSWGPLLGPSRFPALGMRENDLFGCIYVLSQSTLEDEETC